MSSCLATDGTIERTMPTVLQRLSGIWYSDEQLHGNYMHASFGYVNI